jgi:hypothetical protein
MRFSNHIFQRGDPENREKGQNAKDDQGLEPFFEPGRIQL